MLYSEYINQLFIKLCFLCKICVCINIKHRRATNTDRWNILNSVIDDFVNRKARKKIVISENVIYSLQNKHGSLVDCGEVYFPHVELYLLWN